MIQLSVIISINNRAETLRACLEALCYQTQPARDFEVIVVVDGHSDLISERVANLTLPYKLHVIQQQHRRQGIERGYGVEAATGRYCLFLDGDNVARPKLVAEHLRVQRDRDGIVGLGQTLLKLPHRANAFARYLAQERRDRYARLSAGAESPSFIHCDSANFSAPRAALLEATPFAPDLPDSDSIELGYRLGRQGLSFVFIPDAMAERDYHHHFSEIVNEAEKAGSFSMELYQRDAPALSRMKLGSFNNMGQRAILLRRFLLAVGAPIRPLAVIYPLIESLGWGEAWHSFLYDYCYWRGVRRAVPDSDTWLRLTCGTTILMYHACGKPGEAPSRYVVSARAFERQMAWLKWRRFNVLGLDEFLRYLREYRLPPPRSVVITFDDGYADVHTIAYPVLHRHGFPATVFLVSAAMGTVNQWDSEGELAGRPLLSRTQVNEMLNGGFTIGSHTKNHVSITTVTPTQVEDEVHGSRADLERELDLPVLAFAYPNGRHDSLSQAIVKQAGFLGACGSLAGVNDPATSPYLLRRAEIRGTDSLFRFAFALRFGRTRVFPYRSRSNTHPPNVGNRVSVTDKGSSETVVS